MNRGPGPREAGSLRLNARRGSFACNVSINWALAETHATGPELCPKLQGSHPVDLGICEIFLIHISKQSIVCKKNYDLHA